MIRFSRRSGITALMAQFFPLVAHPLPSAAPRAPTFMFDEASMRKDDVVADDVPMEVDDHDEDPVDTTEAAMNLELRIAHEYDADSDERRSTRSGSGVADGRLSALFDDQSISLRFATSKSSYLPGDVTTLHSLMLKLIELRQRKGFIREEDVTGDPHTLKALSEAYPRYLHRALAVCRSQGVGGNAIALSVFNTWLHHNRSWPCPPHDHVDSVPLLIHGFELHMNESWQACAAFLRERMTLWNEPDALLFAAWFCALRIEVPRKAGWGVALRSRIEDFLRQTGIDEAFVKPLRELVMTRPRRSLGGSSVNWLDALRRAEQGARPLLMDKLKIQQLECPPSLHRALQAAGKTKFGVECLLLDRVFGEDANGAVDQAIAFFNDYCVDCRLRGKKPGFETFVMLLDFLARQADTRVVATICDDLLPSVRPTQRRGLAQIAAKAIVNSGKLSYLGNPESTGDRRVSAVPQHHHLFHEDWVSFTQFKDNVRKMMTLKTMLMANNPLVDPTVDSDENAVIQRGDWWSYFCCAGLYKELPFCVTVLRHMVKCIGKGTIGHYEAIEKITLLVAILLLNDPMIAKETREQMTSSYLRWVEEDSPIRNQLSDPVLIPMAVREGLVTVAALCHRVDLVDALLPERFQRTGEKRKRVVLPLTVRCVKAVAATLVHHGASVSSSMMAKCATSRVSRALKATLEDNSDFLGALLQVDPNVTKFMGTGAVAAADVRPLDVVMPGSENVRLRSSIDAKRRQQTFASALQSSFFKPPEREPTGITVPRRRETAVDEMHSSFGSQ